jgi:tetratricopeptide (TPR) repeat protein
LARRSCRAVILAALFICAVVSPAIGETLNEGALEQGLLSEEGRALALIQESRGKPHAERLRMIDEAIVAAPNLPAVYGERAWASFPNVLISLTYFIKGIKTYRANFWWMHGLLGLLFVSCMAALYASFILIAAIRTFQDLPGWAHEINERKFKFIAMFLPLGLVPLGPIAVVAGTLVLYGVYFRKMAKLTVYVLLAVLGVSPVLHRESNYFVSASTPELRAIVGVSEGTDNRLALDVLGGARDFAGRFTHATALKRIGRYEESIEAFRAIVAASPDPRAWTNLGNAYVGIGDREAAKAAYEQARTGADPVVPLYNLSQLHRDALDYTAGDRFFGEAMALDRVRVASFSARAGTGPNRFVLDDVFDMRELRAIAAAHMRNAVALTPLPPLAYSGLAVFLFVVFIVLDVADRNRAFACSTCGKVVCPLCTHNRKWGTQCQDCYAMEHSPDDTTPRARVARMLMASKEREKERRNVKVLSYTVPGLAHVAIGKVFSGLVLLWLFWLCVLLAVLNPLFTTGMAGYSHGWILPAAIVGAVLAYIISAASIARRLEMGWL